MTGSSKYKSVILKSLNLSKADKDLKNYHFIHGVFGTGKSELINEIKEDLIHSGFDGLLFSYKANRTDKYIYDFAAGLLNNCIYHPGEPGFTADETTSLGERFIKILKSVRLDDTKFFGEIFADKLLKPFWERSDDHSDRLVKRSNEYFSLNSEKRIIAESDKIIIESMIVDMLNYFGLDKSEPGKAIFFIDDYDLIAARADRLLLNTLLDYIDKPFPGFISFEPSGLLSGKKVSDILDLKIVISGRDYLTDEILKDKASDIYKTSGFYRLNTIGIKEIKDLLLEKFPDSGFSPDKILDLTKGIPALVKLISEEDYKNEGFFKDEGFRQITKFYSKEQINWITILSKFEEFDSFVIRCIKQMKERENLVNYFITKNPSLFIKNKNKSFTVSSRFRYFLDREQPFGLTNDQISELTSKIISAQKYLYKFDIKEKEIIRNLVYFKQFDLEILAEKAFPGKSEFIKKICSENQKMFDINDGFYSLPKNKAELLNNANKLIDGENHSDKIELSVQINQENITQKEVELKETEEKIKKLETKLDSGKETLAVKEKNIKEIDDKISDNFQFSLISGAPFINSKINLKIPLSYLFISILFVVLIIFKRDIFSGILEYEGTYKLLDYFFGILAIICLIFALRSGFKHIDFSKMFTAKKNTNDEYDNSELKKQRSRIDEEIINITISLKKDISKIETLNEEMKRIKVYLDNPFIDEDYEDFLKGSGI